ncbi:MAG: RNA polymerase sigma-70 factor, ECF subfamily [Candidatus Moranbacteria bacterium GW2011_GWE1_49_15]|nr:MAG: RNA polymerase sigma-70 factor, ECF subfamily [Candidatus Moranbacteria bacterium GW2011_GWE1_49_15]
MLNLEELEKKTDQELVELAKDDQEMFGALMARYQGPLFAYVKRISQLGNEDVEDLLQDIFVKAYLNLNSYESSLKFSSWIYRISHNHVVDNFRRISARPRILNTEDDSWMRIVRADTDLEKELADKDCAGKIKEAIERMPLKYREALVLRFVEDKEYEEIMDILQKPKGTVATLIARGKKLIEKDIKKKGIRFF